ncbi:MAG TPA: DUF1549 domain-containing protein [Gemmataceae bacterium]|jgi:hypothetical protein|nr:DUF1549 domain-containing protein [Gemmataceae bacterium]
MNWKRDVLFIGLVGGGLFALAFNLIPPRQTKAITSYRADLYQKPDFRDSVERVNESFRQQWASDGIQSSGPAPDLAVARRLSLGLMGTVPSLEEIRQFELLPADQRLSWWLDHILEDQRFADNFAERLARAFVGTENGPFIFYRRGRLVDWLEKSIAKNRPYDKIVHDLIADEGLWTDKPATNFISVTAQQDMKNEPNPVRLAGRVTRAFLGLRIDCAQCHDHPFADWKQADFEGISAFFAQTHTGFRGVYDGKGEYEVEDRKTQKKKIVAPRVPFQSELLQGEGTLRQQLAHWVTHKKNRYFSRAAVNRVWALLFGKPLVEPVDNLEPDGPVPPVLQILADDFVAHDFDLRHLIRVIASTEVYRLDSASDHDVSETEEKAWAVFPLTRLRPEQVASSIWQASTVSTVNAKSHILIRLARFGQENEFVTRYGDSGEDEFDVHGGTIPQRLLTMNGKLVDENIKDGPFNATSRIAWMAPNDAKAVETAYLTVFTRRPTQAEAEHFEALLRDKTGNRAQRMEEIYWALINSTEFSWNH